MAADGGAPWSASRAHSPGDDRAGPLATEAAALAERARVALPPDLHLWRLAGGRPRAGTGGDAGPSSLLTPEAAAQALVDALERRLRPDERRRGAHYTPTALADAVVVAAGVGRGGGHRRVVDPACGGGAMLLAAARRLAGDGDPPTRRRVAREALFGADVDALAVAVAETALALWSGGTAPAPGHLVVGDPLLQGAALWDGGAGFDAVVGNPPFQGQLARDTARDGVSRRALRARFGPAVAPYADTAALFLLVALELVRPGGRVALVQPRSVVAARDAGPVRAACAAAARLVDLLVPAGRPFAAQVEVCVPVLVAGEPGDHDWAGRLAAAGSVPAVALVPTTGVVGDRAGVIAGFRQHYYALVDHVAEADGPAVAPLVTCGLLDVGSCSWGTRPVRFARTVWHRPAVDVPAVRSTGPAAVARWLDAVLRPKVLVATQTRVVEAAADQGGDWVPCTPIVAVVPHEPAAADALAAALCAPPVSAWVVGQAAGSGRSAGAVRMSAGLARAVPLPVDADAWRAATVALAAGDLDRYGQAATAMYGLADATGAAVLAWWQRTRR